MMSVRTAPETPRVPTWTPPAWLNTLMIGLLRTPGIERLVGSSIALMTFRGRKSGTLYTTPVSYLRENGCVIITTKRARVWWRNLIDNPRVILRLAGRNVRGIATIPADEGERLSTFVTFLEKRPMDARAYGLRVDSDGHVNADEARALLPQIVMLRIELNVDDASA